MAWRSGAPRLRPPCTISAEEVHRGAGVGPAVRVSVLRGQGVGPPTVKVSFRPGVRTYTEIIRRYIRENANNSSISLTQLAKEYSEESPGYVIQSWMRSRNTLEFLRQWEIAENPDFDDTACEELIRQARSSSLTITPSLWVKRTQAVGMTVKQGKGGGVTVHSEIALDFHLWLDPAARVTMVRIFCAH